MAVRHPPVRIHARSGGGWWDKLKNEFTNSDSDLRSGRFGSKVQQGVSDAQRVAQQAQAISQQVSQAAAMARGRGGGVTGGGWFGPSAKERQKQYMDSHGYTPMHKRTGSGRSGGAGASPAQMAVRAHLAANPHALSHSPGAKAWKQFHASERSKGVPFKEVVTAWRAMHGKGPKRSHAAAVGGSMYLGAGYSRG